MWLWPAVLGHEIGHPQCGFDHANARTAQVYVLSAASRRLGSLRVSLYSSFIQRLYPQYAQ